MLREGEGRGDPTGAGGPHGTYPPYHYILYILMGGRVPFCCFPPLLVGPQATEPPAEPYCEILHFLSLSYFPPRIGGPQGLRNHLRNHAVWFRRCVFSPRPRQKKRITRLIRCGKTSATAAETIGPIRNPWSPDARTGVYFCDF